MQQLNAAVLAEFILTSYPDKNITPMKLQKPCTVVPFERWEYGMTGRRKVVLFTIEYK